MALRAAVFDSFARSAINTSRPNDRLFDGAPIVLPAKAGIHDFPLSQQRKSWMPTSVGMTGWA